MKIVYVIHEFLPDYIGGASVGVLQIAKAMLARGHKVWVLAPQRWLGDEYPSIGFFDEKVDGLSVRKLIFNPLIAPNPILYEYYNPILSIYAKDFLIDVSPDVIHIYHLRDLSSSLIDAAKDLGIPLIITLTDFWFFCPKCHWIKSDGSLCGENYSWRECVYCLKEENSLYDKIARESDETMIKFYSQEVRSNNKFEIGLINNRQISFLLAAAKGRLPFLKKQLEKVNQVICCSPFVGKVFLEKGYFPNGFRVVTHGTTRPEKLPMKKEGKSNITFGYLGGGKKFKGAHILLEAFKQIKCSNVSLKLYGDFPSSEYVNELYRIADGDERIDFMGYFERRELTKVLADIDLLVMPSICYEVYPVSILEAFTNKIPVIATDIGGLPELIHDNINGLLFKRGDVSDLKQKLERVINQPGLIQKFRDNIPQVKSINEECAELLDIYQKALRQP